MNKSGQAMWTAAQIAAALGRSPRAIRSTLEKTAADGVKMVHGNQTATWSIPALPERMRRELEAEASRRGYRNAEALLSHPPEPWQPPLPMDRIADSEFTYASKLQSVLKPYLLKQNDLRTSSAELEAAGLAEYFRVFGEVISGRTFRELVRRTRERDRATEDWDRLAIYLPSCPRAKKDPASVVTEEITEEFSDLVAYIEACQQPPTQTEERGIWSRAIEHYQRLVSGGSAAKRAARNVRAILFSKARFLAPSRDALLKAFERKLAACTESGAAGLSDGRANNGGDDFDFPQSDLDLVEAKIVFHYGEYAPAWREALVKGELSEETRRRYARTHARKSHVPQKLIATLGKRPLWLYTLHRRRKDFNSLKAHFDTVYDGLHTLDCISADDVTLPVWFWFQPDPSRPPIITRGQCLVFIDLLSKRILGWSLQPDKTYNALVIYTQTARVFAEKGVPSALLFEHGIWEKSKLITGTAPSSVAEVTQGLKEFGVEFFHADTPQGKWEIEQVMGLIQNLMEGEPGYCGRDERRDRPDWIKKQLAEVQSTASPMHPSKYFYSFEQWNRRLADIFEQYNASSQGGKLMRNRTPDQVYVENWNQDDPPIRLGPELRYLFAHAKYEKTVEPGGITITSGNRKFKYFGPELADLVGYRVLAWFDPEFTDFITVTDMRRRNPIAVPLHTGVPRLERLTNPEGTALAEACERREGQVGAVVARYNLLKDKFEMPYRRNLVAAQTVELGQRMTEQRASAERAKAERVERGDRFRRQAARLNIPAAMVGDGDSTQRGLALIAEAEREHQREVNKVSQEEKGE